MRRLDRAFMKITVFDEMGKKIYNKSGNPDNCLRDAILNLRFNYQLINLSDVANFNFGELNMVNPAKQISLAKRLLKNEYGSKNTKSK